MRNCNRFRGPFGLSALGVTFLVGLLLALFWPWVAVMMLCLAMAAGVLLLVKR